MRIVFMGANFTGWLCLREMLAMGEQVVGIFTSPASFEISYSDKPVNIATYHSFDELASSYGIPLVTVAGQLGQYTDTLAGLKPDIVIVSGWYYLIPKKMLGLAPLGFVGFHPSLLPKYRGGAPLTWAIINGERETGMTMFYFDKEVDGGDIIAQARVKIDDDDTIAMLYDKVNQATLSMLREMVPRLRSGTAQRSCQDEAQATYFPQRSPADGLIDWSRPTQEIYNWVRAQTMPYPGAYTYLNGQKLIVWATRLLKSPNNLVPGMSGYVMRVHGGQGAEVLTGDGSLLITSVELEGRCVQADDVLNRVGMRLGLQRTVS